MQWYQITFSSLKQDIFLLIFLSLLLFASIHIFAFVLCFCIRSENNWITASRNRKRFLFRWVFFWFFCRCLLSNYTNKYSRFFLNIKNIFFCFSLILLLVYERKNERNNRTKYVFGNHFYLHRDPNFEFRRQSGLNNLYFFFCQLFGELFMFII